MVVSTHSQETSVPDNQFRPNNTLDAQQPLLGEEVAGDEDVVATPLPGEEGYVEPDAETPPAATEGAAEVEKEARDGGWVTEAEWLATHNGAKKGWKSASEFLDFKSHFLPIVQKETRALRAQVALLQAKDRQREKDQRERDSRIETAATSAELKEAAESGDWDRFNELNTKLVKALAAQATTAAAATPTLDPEVQAEVAAFAESNPWIRTDKHASRAFAREMKLIMETNTADSLIDAMEQAREEVVRRYPERFRRAPTRAMGESSGDSTRLNGGKNHAWANLKPIYREQAEKDVRAGKYTQKDYLANCTDENFRG
jgi:hypothetical protein